MAPLREMPKVPRDDGIGTTGDRRIDVTHIVRVRQINAARLGLDEPATTFDLTDGILHIEGGFVAEFGIASGASPAPRDRPSRSLRHRSCRPSRMAEPVASFRSSDQNRQGFPRGSERAERTSGTARPAAGSYAQPIRGESQYPRSSPLPSPRRRSLTTTYTGLLDTFHALGAVRSRHAGIFGETGAPEEIRTPNPQIRSLMLYPIELRARGVFKERDHTQMIGGSQGSFLSLNLTPCGNS